jgi:hypothetical protein
VQYVADMVVAAFAVSIFSLVASTLAVLYTKSNADEMRRSREIQEAAEHRQSAPNIAVALGEPLGGNGYELILTSVDCALDSVTVSWLKGVDATADRSVVGLSDRPAGLPAGTMGLSAETPALAAGAVAVLGIWITSPQEAAGALIRLSCEARIGNRTWPGLIRDVTFPTPVPSPMIASPPGRIPGR